MGESLPIAVPLSDECGGDQPSTSLDTADLAPIAHTDVLLPSAHGPHTSSRRPPPQLRAHDFDSFVRLQVPPRELLLAPWLPRGGTAMVYGPRGLGKTYMSLSVAYAIASGGSFLKWTAPRPSKVLYIDGEMSAAEMQSRVKAIEAQAVRRLPDPSYLQFLADAVEHGGLPDLSSRAEQARYQEAVAGVDVIVIDNLSTLCRGLKENDADTWASVQEWILEQRRAGRSVILVHHAGKGGAQRGTSRKEDILDSVIALRKPPDWSPTSGACFEVQFEKSRGFYGPDAEPFQAKLTNGVWQVSKINSVRDKGAVQELKAQGLSLREIEKRTGLSKSAVHRFLALGSVSGEAPEAPGATASDEEVGGGE